MHNSVQQAVLMGRVILTGKLQAKTGLHIGGNNVGVAIGGADQVVVRNSLSGEPYVPGSSLKGKSRCLLEKALADKGFPQVLVMEAREGKGRLQERWMHKCKSESNYSGCPICNVFGIAVDLKEPFDKILPTRLLVRDSPMSPDSKQELEQNLNTDMPYTEVKTEVIIDRLTSAATPRQRERVPTGTNFDIELVYNVYQRQDIGWFKYLILSLGLLEGDYLGGQGSRGYGQVEFVDLQIDVEWFNGEKPAMTGLGIPAEGLVPLKAQVPALWDQIQKELADLPSQLEGSEQEAS